MDHPTIRPVVLGDAPAITALLNAVDEFEVGRPETDLHVVEADLEHSDADLPNNSWLAFDDEAGGEAEGDGAEGKLVVYGLLWDDSGAERIDVDHYVLPGHDETGVRVLELMEARVLAKARENGADRAVVHLHLNAAKPTFDVNRLTARGWRTVRRYNVLTKDLTDVLPAEPGPAPAGLVLRDCTAEADRRRAHELCELTFADHFDHQRRTYEQWLEDIDAEHLDWSLVTIASLDGLGDVGAVLARDDRAAMGWVRNIGVVREARGRGVGGHLLRHAFAAFAARGRDTMGLGVDTANETNPLRLYEAHGMRRHFAVDTWEVTLSDGA